MDVPVLLSVAGPAEPELVRAIAVAPGLEVVRRCADVTELLAMAAAGRGALAVVSASYLGIDREVVDRLHRAGVGVVGLANSEDAGRVAALGCDAVVDVATPPSATVTALQRLRAIVVAHEAPGTGSGAAGESGAAGARSGGAAPAGSASAGATGSAASPGGSPPSDAGWFAAAPSPDDAAPQRGQVVAVWGTTGSPGRTVVSANLARLLADRATTCLIDADTRAPSLAQVLGIVEDTSGIAVAARAAANGRLDAEALERAARIFDGLAVLTGLTRPDRWREVPASALSVVLDRCRDVYGWTVVDVAGGWDDDGGDSLGPARDGAREAVLAEADVVVIVGAADPVGIWRLVELLSVRPRMPGRDVVVVTKSRPGVAGPSPQHAVREALARFAGVGEAAIVPYDRAAMDAALLQGRLLSEVAPDSPALAAIARVEEIVAGEPPSRASARKRSRRGGIHKQSRGRARQ
ncbi:MAG TPA: hypothetical protein VFC82_06160 [Actinomycetaceae bacterium]|nr:hypothetical protein [Actinomycetaceae bacterium]